MTNDFYSIPISFYLNSLNQSIYHLTTPVLFLIFNRPEETSLVFNEIKKQQPSFLFIGADGPRKNRPGEEEVCKQTRELVLGGIDWECNVFTRFHNENLGCGKA